MSMRAMRPEELGSIYEHVAVDFPASEYPPENIMRRHMQTGAVRGFVWAEGAQPTAYAFVATAPQCSDCLLLLYAVIADTRGQGVGSRFLQALMEELATDFGRLYIEVERPAQAANADERHQRTRRIAFYERLGFLPIEAIDYAIFGVDMHIFYRLLKAQDAPNPQGAMAALEQIYRQMLPQAYMGNLSMRLRGD